MIETRSYEERMKELEIEYNEFLKTKYGQEWKVDWIRKVDWIKRHSNFEDIKDAGDFGDYLYDFYPEMLM